MTSPPPDGADRSAAHRDGHTAGPSAAGASAAGASAHRRDPRAGPALTQLRTVTWRGVLVRSGREFIRDGCPDLAAALTYWSLLGLFPGAIVVVALVRLVATSEQAVDTITDIVTQLTPGAAGAALREQIGDVVGRRSTSGVLLSFGLLGAVWTASAYLRSFARAANRIYSVPEGRPFYLLIPQQLGLTLVAMVLAAAVIAGLVVSGPVARAVGDALGIGGTALTVWNTTKWPVLVLLAAALLSLLYFVAPNVRQPRFRWFTVGGVVALVVWGTASVGFGFYVANFGTYDATYGALGAVIVFLVWVFLTNSAILFGVEINAELQRGRRMQHGEHVDPDEPALPPKRLKPREPLRPPDAAGGRPDT